MGQSSAVNMCTKYVLFFSCFLLFLVTAGCVAIITYYLANRPDFKIDSFLEFVSDWGCLLCLIASCLCVMSFIGWLGALREYRTCLLIVCLVASCLCVMSFIGWLGALREYRTCPRIFKIILGVFMIVEVALVILVFLLAFEKSAQELLYDEDLYREAIIKYRDPEFESLHETIDTLQKDWECCGISNNEEGYKDWSYNQYFNCSDDIPDYLRKYGDFCSVPFTCCKNQEGIINYACGKNMADPATSEQTRQDTINTKGCFLSLTEIVRRNILWIGIVSLCIIIPEAVLYKLAGDLRFQVAMQRAKWVKYQPSQHDRVAAGRK